MDPFEQLFAQADTAIKQGNLPKAKTLLQQLLKENPENTKARFVLIQLLSHLGEQAALVTLVEQTVQLLPNIPDSWYHYSKIKTAQGDIEAAINALLKAREKIQGKNPLIILIGGDLLALGQAHACWEMIPPAAETDRYHIRLLRAKALAALGATVDAKQHLLGAIEQPDLTIGDVFHMWQASKDLPFPDLELALLKEFLQLKAHTPAGVCIEEQLFLVNSYLACRQVNAAHAELDRLFSENKFNNHEEHVKALVLAGRCAQLMGNKNEALARLTTAHQLAPQSWEVLESFIDLASTEQLATLSASHLAPYIANRTATLNAIAQSPPVEQKIRLMAYARLAERTNQTDLAFDCFIQANEVEKARILNSPKLRFDPQKREHYVEQIISQFPRRPTAVASVTGEPYPIFIVGMPRTGTTVLERILSTFSGIKNRGETATLSQVISQDQWDQHSSKQVGPLAKTTAHWQALRDQYRQLAQISDCTAYTEKMPFNFRHCGYILGMWPEAPILHIRRDPRDVIWSIYTRFFDGGHHYSVDLSWLLNEYILSERLMDHFKAIAPDKILTIDYEAFVHDPAHHGQRIAEFCGLPWDPNCLNFHNNKVASYTSSELQVRQPLNTSGIGRWRRYEHQLTDFFDTFFDTITQSPIGHLQFEQATEQPK